MSKNNLQLRGERKPGLCGSNWLLALLILASFIAGTHESLAGDSGHGGDADEVLIQAVGGAISTFLSTPSGAALFPEVDSQKFKSVFEEIKVIVDEKAVYNRAGLRRTAINIPEEKEIRVDRTLWSPIKEQAGVMVPLVFHEILGVLEIEIEELTISGRIRPFAADILANALQSTQGIWFLDHENLAKPIPLFKTSVKFDSKGRFSDGVVARPSKLKLSNLNLILLEGDKILVFPSDERFLRIIMQDLEADRDGSVMLGRSGWVRFQNVDTVNFFNMFTLKNLYLASGIPLKLGNVTGRPRGFDLNKLGGLKIIYCERLDCEAKVQGQAIPVRVAAFHEDGSLHYLSNSQDKSLTVPLKIGDAATQIQVSVSGLEFSRRGEILRAEPIPAASAEKYGFRFDFFVITVNEMSGAIPISRADRFPVNYANVPVLAETGTSDFLREICVKNGHPVESRPESIFYDSIHYSGEKTFYSARQKEFVTRREGSTQTIKSIECWLKGHIKGSELRQ
ncbi:MAG: hypothetical protein COT74_05625 [Bdellovibrionales bacterium CG10_big_fil_rev_8_21_14_0_10_45_34]|nr:MAG: hypothetical protein COT74_05625 [Bdellovibrionales bacterium CG10_big_fil_rev_8_21_14_0_10_45_34]